MVPSAAPRAMRNPANVFALLATVLGVVFVFLTPLFQVPDEPTHAYRAYQISLGVFVAEIRDGIVGGEVAASLVETARVSRAPENDRSAASRSSSLQRLRSKPLDPANSIFIAFPATAVYSPVAYVPHAIGFVVARWLDVSAPSLCYIGRLTNLLAWAAMVLVAIRITPIYKWLLLVLALLPMSLFEAASMSADATINGLAFVTIALFFKLALEPRQRVGKREIVVLLALCGLVALAKPGYIAIVVLAFLIPHDKLGSRMRQFGLFALLSSVAIGTTLIWAELGRVGAHLQPIADKASAVEISDPVAQMRFILSDPINFVGIIRGTLSDQFEILRQHFVGVLGWLDVVLPQASVDFGCAVLVFIALRESRVDIALGVGHKALLATYVIATTGLIMTVMFLTWSPVAASHINGMQGRYFFPVAPAAFAVLYNRRLRWLGRERDLPWIAIVSVLILFGVAVVALIHRYYND